jgi:hypothetical protein
LARSVLRYSSPLAQENERENDTERCHRIGSSTRAKSQIERSANRTSAQDAPDIAELVGEERARVLFAISDSVMGPKGSGNICSECGEPAGANPKLAIFAIGSTGHRSACALCPTCLGQCSTARRPWPQLQRSTSACPPRQRKRRRIIGLSANWGSTSDRVISTASTHTLTAVQNRKRQATERTPTDMMNLRGLFLRPGPATLA